MLMSLTTGAALMNPTLLFLRVSASLACLTATGLATSVHAGTQTTVVKAPVAAIALGPTKASVSINPTNPGAFGNRTVIVTRPVIAVGVPFKPARIVIR
jgi:hypothetical protein